MKNKSTIILLAIFAIFAKDANAVNAKKGDAPLQNKQANMPHPGKQPGHHGVKGKMENMPNPNVVNTQAGPVQPKAHGAHQQHPHALAPKFQGSQPVNSEATNPNVVQNGVVPNPGEMVIEEGQNVAAPQQVMQQDPAQQVVQVQPQIQEVQAQPIAQQAIVPAQQVVQVQPQIQEVQAQPIAQQVIVPEQQGAVQPQPPVAEEHIDAAADQGADVLEKSAAPQQPGDENKSPIELAAEGKQIISDTEKEASPEEKNLAAMISQNINTDEIVDKGADAVSAKVEVPEQDVQQAHQEVAAETSAGTAAETNSSETVVNNAETAATNQEGQEQSVPPVTVEEKKADIENSTDVLMNGLQGSAQDQAEFQEMIKQLAVGFTEGLDEDKADQVLAENNVPEAARSAIIIAAHNLSADIARKKVSEAVVEQAVDQSTDQNPAAEQQSTETNEQNTAATTTEEAGVENQQQ